MAANAADLKISFSPDWRLRLSPRNCKEDLCAGYWYGPNRKESTGFTKNMVTGSSPSVLLISRSITYIWLAWRTWTLNGPQSRIPLFGPDGLCQQLGATD